LCRCGFTTPKGSFSKILPHTRFRKSGFPTKSPGASRVP